METNWGEGLIFVLSILQSVNSVYVFENIKKFAALMNQSLKNLID